MPPLQAYWMKVALVAAQADPATAAADARMQMVNPKHNSAYLRRSDKQVWITSLKVAGKTGSIGGRVFSVGPWMAGERIASGTHQLSTEEEIKGWHDEQARRRQADAERKAAALPPPPPAPQVHVTLSAEAVQAMRSGKAAFPPPVSQPASTESAGS